MNVAFVDLKKQYKEIKKDIEEAISNVILDAAFINGKYVKDFENSFSKKMGTKHCIGVSNGTMALYLSLRALGIKNNDEVITAANTFIADGEAISLTGATPVFVDNDPDTFCLDTNKIEKVINENTKAIIPVHLYGQPANMDNICELAKKYNLKIVGDACQAPGAVYKDRNVGSLGDTVCYSFFPGKNLGAYGDGGAVLTNSDELADKIRMTANHGRREKYNNEFEGLNSRLDGLQAAILNAKLKYLDKWNDRRIAIANHYDKELKDIVITPKVLKRVKHIYHLYVVKIENRLDLQKYLKNKGISTGIHYPIPLPYSNAYSFYKYVKEDFPNAYKDKDKILSLPIHGSMDDNEVEYVVTNIRNYYNRKNI